MATATTPTYVFKLPAVKKAIGHLTARPIHEHFAGYLAILRGIRANGGAPVRSVDITGFHDAYLATEGAPSRTPYVRPFKSRGQGLELFNANVAGSYAPSSLRTQGKIASVIDVQGTRQNAVYGLQPDHAVAALQNLLRSQKVPALSLAIFLYRDYGFELDQPELGRVLDLFREEFGLRDSNPVERSVFSTLFVEDRSAFVNSDLEVMESTNG